MKEEVREKRKEGTKAVVFLLLSYLLLDFGQSYNNVSNCLRILTLFICFSSFFYILLSQTRKINHNIFFIIKDCLLERRNLI